MSDLDYDSGSYCRYWSQHFECDRECPCGHKCGDHSTEGKCFACACEKWGGEE